MILRALADPAERRNAQDQLFEQLAGRLVSRGVENIGYPGGTTNTDVYVDPQSGLWFARESQHRARVPRYWNAFGFYREGRSQQIAVEVNVPIDRMTQQVAGMFARDDMTGRTYLLHSGKVGGGTKGVGKTPFLIWSGGRLEWCDVVGFNRSEALPYILVGQVGASDIADRIARFTSIVADFKAAARTGELSTPAFRERVRRRERYQREFSGRKRGIRKPSFDYLSYHGDVVDALRSRLISEGVREDDVVNSDLIDLYVKSDSTVSAVYEVKTQVSRGNVYTAIGQLMVHAPAKARRILVLPHHSGLPQDIRICLERLEIDLVQFRLEGSRAKRVVLG